jgi:PAS domain S-box-containing protein
MKHFLCLIVLLFFFFVKVAATDTKIRFEHLTIEDGLSQNTIFSILQDRYGLLWIGTEGGLTVFDGKKLSVFTRDADDPSTLSDNIITALCEQPDGQVWVGTENGLNCYDRQLNLFERIVDMDQDFDLSITITSLLVDREKNLWIGTSGHGLFRFDPRQKSIDRHYIHVPNDNSTLSHNDVQTLFMDTEGILWVGTAGGGVCRYLFSEGIFQALAPDLVDNTDLQTIQVSSILRSRSLLEELWIGTWGNGLLRCNLAKRSVEQHMPSEEAGTISHHEIKTLYEDGGNQLWIGTSAGGLNRYNRQQKSFTVYRHAAHLGDSISQNDITAIYEDRNKILWVGTTAGGLNKYVRHKNLFKRYGHDPLSPASLSDAFVRGLHIDGEKRLWVGTYKGLHLYDPVTDSFVSLQNHQTEKERGRLLIENISEDAEDHLWLATFAGIARFEKATKRFLWFEHRPEDPRSLSHQIVYAVMNDRKGRLWAGTYRGLNRLDPGATGFQHYFHNPKSTRTLPHNMVITLFEDRDGSIWVGTAGGGAAHFNQDSGDFTAYQHHPEDRTSLSHNSVTAICRDSQGRLWIGTADGMNQFDAKAGAFVRYGRKNGFPSSSVAAIIPDEQGALWITHSAGLTRFHPDTGALRTYSAKDGLQGTEFNRAAAARSDSGELFFGGINGFNRFDPAKLMSIEHHASIHLTEVLVSGQNRRFGVPTYALNEIKLRSRDNQITLSFASDDYSSPEGTFYQYMMDGLDQTWTPSGTQRTAHFNQLPPGRFQFKVKASLDGTTWGEPALSVWIERDTPLLMTWWFRSFSLLCLVGLVILFFRLRIRTLRHRLEEERLIRAILEKSKDELQRANQVADLRLAQLREVMASITSVLVAVDTRRRISECNQRAAIFFKTSREQMLDQPLEAFLVDELSGFQPLLAWAYSEPVSAKEKQFVIEQDGAHRLYHVRVYPITTHEGVLQGLLLLLEDITLQAQQETQQYLWEKLKTIGQLQAEITHEIGTPIQEAKFQAYILDKSLASSSQDQRVVFDQGQTSEFKEGLSIIQHNIDRVFAIIKSAKELFYPGRNQKENVNVNKLIETTLMVTRNSLQKRARIVVEYGQELPLIDAYPAELSQVLLNLLGNAADAVENNPAKGEIIIRTSLQAEELVIDVLDNGTGIDPRIGTQIFAPFFTTKAAGKGTGQGLTICRTIIENRHQGRIVWKNRSEKGTIFSVFLPVGSKQ